MAAQQAIGPVERIRSGEAEAQELTLPSWATALLAMTLSFQLSLNETADADRERVDTPRRSLRLF